ncbi:hypothetical protein TWF481_006938 [Arthrobotrys musiformis]|uniref:Carbohydrate kinase PfkB domain-containing protein n=1 Tax=Arthrobotrys musiformis TaxID=47236 RepID=A0AAV9W9Z1_9PEZI
MSLLRASGLRCHLRSLQVSQVVQRSILAPQARHYSDESVQDSSQPSEPPKDVGQKTEPLVWDPACNLINRQGWHAASLKTNYSNIGPKPGPVSISKEVLNALRTRKPILGLETAIYTHGFPKPDNHQLALEMEAVVRDLGVVPATIGILDGEIHIGMTEEQLKRITDSAGEPHTHKISRRDIAYHIASGTQFNGGTTIAGTILLAESVGIRVIATGGLGGVHKGGENSMDISADLTELSRNNIAVVTSGMKSFLDAPRTLEFLETQGVFVSTFGNKSEKVDIPGFFSRESGCLSPYVVESPEEAARIYFASERLGLGSGSLYFNPIPEEYEIPKSEMDPIIASAVEKTSAITGKDNTPAVLAEILKQTEGRSMEANRQLVLNNAKIGARMSLELSRLRYQRQERRTESYNKFKSSQGDASKPSKPKPRKNQQTFKRPGFIKKIQKEAEESTAEKDPKPAADSIIKATNGIIRTASPLAPRTSPSQPSDRKSFSTLTSPEPTTQTGVILVIGGVGIDVIAKCNNKHLLPATSNPGAVTVSVGGVAKNIAATLAQLDPPNPVKFLSAVGHDINGLRVLQDLKALGINSDDVSIKKGFRTASYAAINSDAVEGGLSTAVVDMDVITSIERSEIAAVVEKYKPSIICFDSNLSKEAVQAICEAARKHGALAVWEPTSMPKASALSSLFTSLRLDRDCGVDIVSPNDHELNEIYESVCRTENMAQDRPDILEEQKQKIKGDGERASNTFNSLKELLNRLAADLSREKVTPTVFTYPNADSLRTSISRAIYLLPYFPTIITKLGSKGVLTVRSIKHPNPLEATRNRYTPYYSLTDEIKEARDTPGVNTTAFDANIFIPAEPYDPETQIIGTHIHWTPAGRKLTSEDIVSSNGAGDTFLGSFLHNLCYGPKAKWATGNIIASPWMYFEDEELVTLIRRAQLSAVRTLQSAESHPIREPGSLQARKELLEKRLWERSIEDLKSDEIFEGMT